MKNAILKKLVVGRYVKNEHKPGAWSIIEHCCHMYYPTLYSNKSVIMHIDINVLSHLARESWFDFNSFCCFENPEKSDECKINKMSAIEQKQLKLISNDPMSQHNTAN